VFFFFCWGGGFKKERGGGGGGGGGKALARYITNLHCSKTKMKVEYDTALKL